MNTPLCIYVLSDSLGETANRVVQAALAQFPADAPIKVKKFVRISKEVNLTAILQAAAQDQAILVTTLVDDALNATIQQFATQTHLRVIDYMSPLLQAVSDRISTSPAHKPLAQYQLDEAYFKRIEAVEFAVKYDDGKDARGFLDADIVILGVSRTSKTPVSMYLAHKGFKVANLPLIEGMPLPDTLFQIAPHHIFGLMASPRTILKYRQSRFDTLGYHGENQYVALDYIQNELRYAQSIFNQLHATIIHTDYMAIEETAQQIECQYKAALKISND